MNSEVGTGWSDRAVVRAIRQAREICEELKERLEFARAAYGQTPTKLSEASYTNPASVPLVRLGYRGHRSMTHLTTKTEQVA